MISINLLPYVYNTEKFSEVLATTQEIIQWCNSEDVLYQVYKNVRGDEIIKHVFTNTEDNLLVFKLRFIHVFKFAEIHYNK